jgi:hypothetical protein
VNKIYRPTQIYVGEHDLAYLPIQERDVPLHGREKAEA